MGDSDNDVEQIGIDQSMRMSKIFTYIAQLRETNIQNKAIIEKQNRIIKQLNSSRI